METQVETAEQGKMPDTPNSMSKQVKAESVTSPGNDGRVRCAIYARYSSDNQRKSSIEDQIRNCREAADRKSWVVLDEYIFSDSEKTGTTIHGRTGLKTVMDFAKAKPKLFDYIIVDDSSRFGRNKTDAFKNVDILHFHKVRLYFVEDGLDSGEHWFDQAFHNNAQRDEQYSKSLGHKVRRGRRGRFINGYNPGGYCYGYRNVPDEDITRKGEYGRPAVNDLCCRAWRAEG
jgi:DNA invertase Pin-like site-specific DNA recombinase